MKHDSLGPTAVEQLLEAAREDVGSATEIEALSARVSAAAGGAGGASKIASLLASKPLVGGIVLALVGVGATAALNYENMRHRESVTAQRPVAPPGGTSTPKAVAANGSTPSLGSPAPIAKPLSSSVSLEELETLPAGPNDQGSVAHEQMIAETIPATPGLVGRNGPVSTHDSAATVSEVGGQKTTPVVQLTESSAEQPSSQAESAASDREALLLLRAQRALQSSPGTSLRLAREHGSSYPSSALTQEREVLVVDALARLGRINEAKARIASFRQRYSGSALLKRINAIEGRLRSPGRTEAGRPD